MMNFAIKNILFAVPFVAAAIGLASPANAFQAPDRSANGTEASAQTNRESAPAAATKDASNKICVLLPALTGSRMSSRQCKTKAQWESLGYELGEKK
jgi:hypothetical protein